MTTCQQPPQTPAPEGGGPHCGDSFGLRRSGQPAFFKNKGPQGTWGWGPDGRIVPTIRERV